MVTLEGFLNKAIPIGIFVIFAGIFINAFKKPIGSFFGFIRDLYERASDTDDFSPTKTLDFAD